MKPEIFKLNRFTTLPFLIDLINRKKLSLLNPQFWEDYNDRKTIDFYKNKIGAKSIYALCLTFKSETVHHWNAFSNGPSGCCIEFSYSKLSDVLEKYKVKHDKVTYLNIADLNTTESISQDLLPFVKRSPFRLENEYRILFTSEDDQMPSYEIPITMEMINRITLSNKLPRTTFNSLKKMIIALEPELEGKINRSSMYENTRWIDHFSKI